MAKITSVTVGWKHITDVKPPKPGHTSFNVSFPKITFSGNDLKGRTRWTNAQWLQYAVGLYQKQKGFKPHTKDEFVERSSKPVKPSAKTKINPNKKTVAKKPKTFIALWTTENGVMWAEACPTEPAAFTSAAKMVAQITGLSTKDAFAEFVNAMNAWDCWEVIEGGPDRITIVESKKFNLIK
jgi:hypothetical protein